MKQYIILLALSCLAAAGCKKVTGDSFLDKTDTGTINEKSTFSDSTLTMNFLNGIYRYLQYSYFLDNGTTGGALWAYADATDDAEQHYSGATAQTAQAYNSATFDKAADFARMKADHWNNPYSMIRRVTIFLEDVDMSPLSDGRKKMAKAEARFLRAYYYFHLLRTHGGIPLLGNKRYALTDNFDMPRNSFDDCVKYIAAELDEVAQVLPVEHRAEDYGRPTKGACLAIKARLLLMAASPLFNGGNLGTNDAQKNVLGYASYDAERWKKAADAAKAVMDMGIYSLVEDNSTKAGYGFYNTFLQRKNAEHIFQIMQDANRFYETYLLPSSRAGNYSSYPTQQIVDAFPMANGKMINEAGSGYNPDKPYDNRDPRFYYSILYNGSSWLLKTTNNSQPLYTYLYAPSDGMLSSAYATRTGYYWRKMCDENAGGNYGTTPTRCLPVVRYAEILLNYAEALNEYSGASMEVYNAVEAVRKRAGLSPYQLTPGLSKEQMRAAIHNERRVELALEEGHRFFDLLRWKEFDTKVGGDMYGMQWTKNSDGSFSHTTIVFEKRKFNSPQMYFMPVPQSEINRAPSLVQNPGW